MSRAPDKPGPHRPPPARPRSDDPGVEQRALRIIRDLHDLGRIIAEARGLERDEASAAEGVVVPVPVRLDRRAGAPGEWDDARRLARDLATRIDEALSSKLMFRQGRVHCFQCDQPDCGHDRPPSPTDTFGGYTPTGKPEWRDFPNLLIERKDPRVDRLYDNPPQVVAVVVQAAELKGDLLPGFGRGSRSYNVLGQVVAGLIASDLSFSRHPPNRVALTFQLIETRGGGEARRLRLNLLGLSADEITQRAVDESVRGPAAWLRRAVIDTRHRLEGLGRRAAAAERRGEPIDLEHDVQPLLQALRGDLERVFRPDARRTAHAVERHLDGERPTAFALRDAREVAPDRFLRDAERDTVVVLGPRGRTHVFSPDGRHVTSMTMGAGELDRKFVRSRWRPMSRDAVAEFLKRL